MEKFIEILKEEENKELEKKTSWEKNEVKLALSYAHAKALIRYLGWANDQTHRLIINM